MPRQVIAPRCIPAVALAFIGLLPCLAVGCASAEPAVPAASVPEPVPGDSHRTSPDPAAPPAAPTVAAVGPLASPPPAPTATAIAAAAAAPSAPGPAPVATVSSAPADIAALAAPERAAFTASIPGTTVDIEMLPVPDGLLGRPLWVARTETTWDAYDAFVFELARPAEVPADLDAVVRPSHPYILADYGFGHAGFPVISVSHAGASAFCEWLSVLTGRRFRLPTEAEFDALCAAAAIAPDTLAQHAWIESTSDDQTHAVATLAADALGLHDLLGNAAEWCTAADGTPVSKGGAYLDGPQRVTCAARRVPTPAWNMRDPQLPKSRWWLSDASFAGFRIVCDDAP